MTNSFKNWALGILSAIFLIGIFVGGFYTYPKVYPPPIFTSSHTVVYDTAKKHMYHIYPWYVIEQKDSIIYNEVPANVDTAEILKNHYATYQYNRQIEDTNLLVMWQDNISQNKAMPVDGFDYVWKKPLTVIENIDKSVTYSKYIYAGGSINLPDIKYSDVSLYYAYQRGLFGAGYLPMVKGGGVKLTGAFTLFKIK